jgi:hypothetical protein
MTWSCTDIKLETPLICAISPATSVSIGINQEEAATGWLGTTTISKSIGIVPESLGGSALPPTLNTQGVWSSSVFIGFDFDF